MRHNFKNGPSKICGRPLLKNFTQSILEYFVPYQTFVHFHTWLWRYQNLLLTTSKHLILKMSNFENVNFIILKTRILQNLHSTHYTNWLSVVDVIIEYLFLSFTLWSMRILHGFFVWRFSYGGTVLRYFWAIQPKVSGNCSLERVFWPGYQATFLYFIRWLYVTFTLLFYLVWDSRLWLL